MIRFGKILAVLVVLGLSATADAVRADIGPAGTSATAIQGQELPPGVPEVVILPPTATTRTYVHVFLAFTIAFALLGGYVYFVARRFSALEEELARRVE